MTTAAHTTTTQPTPAARPPIAAAGRGGSATPAIPLAVATLAALALAACESEVVAPPEEVFEEGVITVDATSPMNFAYLTLGATAAQVTPPDPFASTDWHLGIRRFAVRLNGGVSGPGSVAGVNLGNNAGLLEDQVVALTEADGEAAFQAVTEADIPPASSFMEDGLAPDPGSSWFRFDFVIQNLVANPGAAWKVRESSGRGYAVFRVVELEMEGQRPVGGTLEFRRHEPNGTLGASETIAADLRRGPAFLSFADGLAMNPAGCGWDIGFTPDLTVAVNADCGAGTFPVDATEDFTMLAKADDAPDYAGFLSAISGAFPATVDDASGAFWYDIQGNRRMWPTYNVFLVQVDEQVYKLQVTSYYDATGNSGHVRLRHQRLR